MEQSVLYVTIAVVSMAALVGVSWYILPFLGYKHKPRIRHVHLLEWQQGDKLELFPRPLFDGDGPAVWGKRWVYHGRVFSYGVFGVELILDRTRKDKSGRAVDVSPNLPDKIRVPFEEVKANVSLSQRKHCKLTRTVSSGGREEWRLNGVLHREDGPACIWPEGTEEWWLNSKRHRLDGPAFIRSDGYKRWFINGLEISEEDFNAMQNHKLLFGGQN
jgi:hypothetical protein